MKMSDCVKINKLQTTNRLVMPPMATKSALNGEVNHKLIKFYTDRCGGGHIGLVITEHSYVDKQGMATANQLAIDDEGCIEGLSRLTESIKKSGSLVFAQLSHAGRRAVQEITGMIPVSSSADEGWDKPVKALDRDEIHYLVQAYANAAVRAKKAGYDGVELHSAHGYLLNQFYSPLVNHRHDEYGCDCIENRVRFHVEIIKAIREKLGEDYPVGVRLGGCDYMEGGSTIADSVEAAKLLEKAGADFIDISGGLCGFSVYGRTHALFSDMSTAVKKAVSVPVILTGGIRSGAEALNLVENGAADLIGVGRALIANPKWADEEL